MPPPKDPQKYKEYCEKVRESVKGENNPNYGNKWTDEQKQKEREKMLGKNSGEKSCFWKGDDVSYAGIHQWVKKWKGSPDTCEKCGRSGLTGRQIDWANIDHQYRRVLDDYIRMCRKCHGIYDKEHGLRKHKHKKYEKIAIK